MLRYLHTAVRNVAQTAVCNGAGFSAISRFRNIALFAQYRIRQLRHEQALVSSDDLGATGRRLLRFDFADQLAFVRISGQQNAGHAEIMERLQYRIVHGSAPPVLRATTTCNPRSEACAKYGTNARSGLPRLVETKS